MHPKEEKTLVLVKPDGVARGLIGEILNRFERRGLKVIALKMVWADRGHVSGHYPSHNDWFHSVGTRTSAFFLEKNVSVQDNFGTTDPIMIGQQVKSWLEDYMVQGPIVAMVITGMHAITTVRKLTGHTYPVEALPGTIRGDFSVDTPAAANTEKRVVKNIIHASGNNDEAAHEIFHWFKPEELFDYKRSDEDVMF
jgi:nucleoside-diphosphate kinase